MSTIVKWWKAESALIAAVIVALAGVVTLPGSWEKVLGALLPLIAGGAVRKTVWAPDTVQGAVQAAATQTAAALAPTDTGAPGVVTVAGQAVAATAAATVLAAGPGPVVTGGGITVAAGTPLVGKPDPPT
jgi:hypothetical protein